LISLCHFLVRAGTTIIFDIILFPTSASIYIYILMLWEKIYEQSIMLDVHLLYTKARTNEGLFCFCERFTNFPIAPKTIHEMKLLSSIMTVITVLLAAPRAFGSKLHFENMEVSTGELTDISNDGLPEEGCHGGLCLTSRPDPLDHGAYHRQPSSSCSGLCIPPISL
jgi:hypothetical protein